MSKSKEVVMDRYLAIKGRKTFYVFDKDVSDGQCLKMVNSVLRKGISYLTIHVAYVADDMLYLHASDMEAEDKAKARQVKAVYMGDL